MKRFARTSSGQTGLDVKMLTLLGVMAMAVALAGLAGLAGCSDSDDPVDPGATTGNVNGRVIEPVSGNPVVGAAVSIDPVAGKAETTTTTDSNGDFSFADLEPGNYTVTVDASGIVVDPSNPDLEFAGYSSNVTVTAGQDSDADFFTPVVDTNEDVTVTPGEPTILEVASIPGLRIDIQADAVTFPDGSTTGELNVVQLGFNQGPIPLDSGVAPTIMVRILPEGTVFDPPATVRFPNRDGMPDGHGHEIYSHDGEGWTLDGGATASGDFVDSDSGVGIGSASTHYLACDPTTVLGNIHDVEQQPVAGADVQIWAWVDPFGEGGELVSLTGKTTTTDATGDFAVADVSACRISFSAEMASDVAAGRIGPVEWQRSGETGETDLGDWTMELQTQTFFSITGTVTWDDGSPAAGVAVGVSEGQQKQPVFTNDDGVYMLAEIVADPGQSLHLWAFDEISDSGTDTVFEVPPLSQSGTTLTIDLQLCRQQDSDPCGEWGDWTLSGTTLTVSFNSVECGVVVSETSVTTVLSLENGVLTIVVHEDQGADHTEILRRVSGSGPSGISNGNLPGLYAIDSDDAYIVLYADGTLNWVSAVGDFPGFEHGIYDATATQLEVTVLFSTDETEELGVPFTVDYTRSGDLLTISEPGGQPEQFGRCQNSFDGGLEGEWVSDHGQDGSFTLILYNGEYAGVDRY